MSNKTYVVCPKCRYEFSEGLNTSKSEVLNILIRNKDVVGFVRDIGRKLEEIEPAYNLEVQLMQYGSEHQPEDKIIDFIVKHGSHADIYVSDNNHYPDRIE